MNNTLDRTGGGTGARSRGLPSCVVLLMAASLVTPECLAAEDEPNDTLAMAATSHLVGMGTFTLEERLLGDGDWPERDVDLYGFVIDETTDVPVMLTIEVDSGASGLDAYLRLFRGPGVELASNDDGASGEVDPRLRTLLTAPDVYYVGVSTSGNPHYDPAVGGSGRPGTGGTYALTIGVEPYQPPDSLFEPNDSIAAATYMGRESWTSSGEFIGDGDWGRKDVDVYWLCVTGRARIDVSVDSEAYSSILDPVVRLRNCEDAISAPTFVDPCLMGASEETHGGAGLAEASVGVLEAQDVYIMVSGSGNRRYDPALLDSGEPGSVGYYDMTVTVTYYTAGTGINEPNDSLAMSVHLPPFVAGRPEVIEIDAFLGDGPYAPFQGDRDIYEITVIDEMRLVTIDVETETIGSDLDPVVFVYDSWALVTHRDSWGGASDAQIVLPVPCVPVFSSYPSGYVMVMGTKQRPPGDPIFPYGGETIIPPHVLDDGPGSTGPYHLTVSVEDVEPYADDPGDTLATATDTGIVDGGFYARTQALIGDSACANPDLDVDMWSLEVVHPPARVYVMVSVCSDDPDALDMSGIRVFDSGGSVLASVWPSRIYELPVVLDVTLTEPGTYFVGATGDSSWYHGYDPHVACSGEAGEHGHYDIAIIVTRPGMQQTSSRGSTAGTEPGASDEDPPFIFAKRFDAAEAMIDVLDADTGLETASLPTPESRPSALGGLAYNGSFLYYLGAGKYPRLYQLDPITGTVIDDFILWIGSGYYGDAVMLGGELHLLDFRTGIVHVIDPVGQRFLRSLHVAPDNDITIGGALAALTGSDRLYVTDAFNTNNIYEVDPRSGAVTATLSPPSNRPTALAGVGDSMLYIGDWESSTLEVIDREGHDLGIVELEGPPASLAGNATIGFFADFDGDRDVDLIDFAHLQRCFSGPTGTVAPGCEPGDRNGDGHVDLSDFAAYPASFTGP